MEKTLFIPMWMLNTLYSGLQKLYEEEAKKSNLNMILKYVDEKHGREEALKIKKQMEANPFTKLGKICESMKRIDEMRDSYTKEFETIKKDNHE